MMSRRVLLGTLGALLLTRQAMARPRRPQESEGLPLGFDEADSLNPDPFGHGAARLQSDPYGPYGSDESWYVGSIPDDPFSIPVVDPGLIEAHWRPQTVPYAGPESAGIIVIKPQERFLYLVQPNRTARRYGIGVGRQGFAWSGTAQIRHKAKWPSWRPPAEMRRRRPDLPAFMAGGPDNPLGSRALYLYQGERDTLYRIHGTNEPDTIGQAVSSGCIRLLNEDVYDLYNRVPVGTVVKVEGGGRRPEVDPEGLNDEVF
jgi:lipoprotein-anchoring transpeptidase ErfK/SrfK